MPTYLNIHVHFLGGYYHGEEWPPAPMRLMQAIVAGSAHAGQLESATSTLDWLEQQPPPAIHAPEASAAKPFTVYVPRNSDDKTLRRLCKGISPHEAMTERRERYDAQPTLRRWVREPVTYQWHVADAIQAKKLGLLSHELVCLGRAEDLAFASFELSDTPLKPNTATWQAAPEGTLIRNPLRVPVPGSLASLRGREQARGARIESKGFVDPPVAYGERSYDRGTSGSQRPYLLYDLHDTDGDGWLGWRHNEGVVVAAMIRHAIDTCVPESLRAYATGHVTDGDLDDRLSWIPLPSIGQRYADGRIRRAMLLAPESEETGSQRWRELRHAMAHASLEHHGRQIGTMEATDEIADAVKPYLATGSHWRTVTPLITHGKTTRGTRGKGRFDRRKAEKLILHALAKAGLPEPVDMHFQAAPFERSGRAARDYRVPKHLSGLSRFHVSIGFAESVSGPVIAGVGRHFGLGLFRSVSKS